MERVIDKVALVTGAARGIGVNLTGTFNGIKATIPALKKSRRQTDLS